MANRVLKKGQMMNMNTMRRLASAYRFALIWCDSSLSPLFFEALGWPTGLIVFGPSDDIKSALPVDDMSNIGVLELRDYVGKTVEEGAEKLARKVEKIGSSKERWEMSVLGWRQRRLETRREFNNLFQNSFDGFICRKLCI
jgi:hypothetical protein